MASPQTENGFTRIANEIVEALARTRISGEARQVVDVILRKTYGFQKTEDQISLSQFVLSTSIKRPNVCRALNKLLSMNLIIKKDNGKIPTYRFNKDFDTWKPLSKKITIIKKDNESLSKKIHTKETIQKKTIAETSSAKKTPLVEMVEKKEPPDFETEAWFEETKAKDQPHLNIIVWYLRMIRVTFPSKVAANAELKRWLRPAQILAEYPKGNVKKAQRKAKEEYPDKWNLGTVAKVIPSIKN